MTLISHAASSTAPGTWKKEARMFSILASLAKEDRFCTTLPFRCSQATLDFWTNCSLAFSFFMS